VQCFLMTPSTLICNGGNHQKAKPMDMNRHPATSGSSHLLGGVYLGVSARDGNRNSLKLPAFSA